MAVHQGPGENEAAGDTAQCSSTGFSDEGSGTCGPYNHQSARNTKTGSCDLSPSHPRSSGKDRRIRCNTADLCRHQQGCRPGDQSNANRGTHHHPRENYSPRGQRLQGERQAPQKDGNKSKDVEELSHRCYWTWKGPSPRVMCPSVASTCHRRVYAPDFSPWYSAVTEFSSSCFR